MSAFRQSDARLFFGRRQETLEALAGLGDQQQTNPERLAGSGGSAYHRWLQIEGNSGAGKSSLVHAGMLPMIERGALWARTGFERWRILGPMMPGANPLAKLAETLGLRPFRLDDDRRALYHAGAAIASNYLVTLRRAAGELFAEAGVPEEALDPLMRRVIENGFQLTGPIERGDWETVERHRQAIADHAPHHLPAYDELARLTAGDTVPLGSRS